MNRLFRVRIRPRSSWRTPWQADTLAGLLCWMCARSEGEAVLRTELLEPMLAGEPPFVLSDAFPGELLPIPLVARLADWSPDSRKTVKRARWLRPAAFAKAQAGESIDLPDLVTTSPIAEHDQIRNTLDRQTDTTGDAGSLFSFPEYRLNPRSDALQGADWFSVYVRVRPDAESLLLDLLEELSRVGFGADASAGKGAFDFPGDAPELEPMDALNGSSAGANGMIALSTFQPGRRDPVHGLWESFTKFGKLGPDFGVADVRKYPLLLFRPGACFAGEPRAFVGRAVPMHELLPLPAAAQLAERGVETVHPAFGLAVSAQLASMTSHV